MPTLNIYSFSNRARSGANPPEGFRSSKTICGNGEINSSNLVLLSSSLLIVAPPATPFLDHPPLMVKDSLIVLLWIKYFKTQKKPLQRLTLCKGFFIMFFLFEAALFGNVRQTFTAEFVFRKRFAPASKGCSALLLRQRSCITACCPLTSCRRQALSARRQQRLPSVPYRGQGRLSQ